MNYLNNLNESHKMKNVKLVTPSRNFTLHENRIPRNDRYANFGRTMNTRKEESMSDLVLPSISKAQQSSYGTNKVAKNSNNSFIMSDNIESNIPLGISSLKSMTNNDDTSESKSNDPPVSTPEFVETPLLSKQNSNNARDFSSTTKSALSTFKRTSATPNDDFANEPVRNETNNECKPSISERIASQIQVIFYRKL